MIDFYFFGLGFLLMLFIVVDICDMMGVGMIVYLLLEGFDGLFGEYVNCFYDIDDEGVIFDCWVVDDLKVIVLNWVIWVEL